MTATEERVRSLVQSARLPSLLTAYQRLLHTLDDPNSTGERVALALRADPGLTARVLKVSNNAVFGQTRRVESLVQAVTVLGTNRIRHLALGGAVLKMFKGIPPHLLNVRQFWEHSLAVAFGSEILGRRVGLSPEPLFVAGLLHDIGVLLLCANLPEEARRVLVAARSGRQELHHVERAVLGFDHPEVGAELLSSWGLTGPATAARWHHSPSDTDSRTVDVVHVADVLASELRMGSLGDAVPHSLDEAAAERLLLSGPALDGVIRDLRSEWGEAVGMFFA